MGYYKLYYALLDLKKVVIYALCILTTRFFYFAFLASLHIFGLFAIENCYLFLFFANWIIVISLHDLNTKKH